MKFFIILLVIGIQRYLNIRFSLSDMDWFKPYRAMVEKTLGKATVKGYVGLAIIVLPIALLVWLLNMLLGGNLLLGFIIGAIVLFYTLDARDLSNQIPTYLGREKKEKGKSADEELKEFLQDMMPTSAKSSASAAAATSASATKSSAAAAATAPTAPTPTKSSATSTFPATPSGKARAVSSKILLWSQHHVFSILFWYLFFGVFGAVVYFLVHRLSHEAMHNSSDVADYADASQVVQGIMAWVPVRLAGLSYGAVGAFGTVINQWTRNIAGGLDLEQKLPVIFGLSAVNADIENPEKATVEENKSILDVIFKAEIVWIAVSALFALIALI